MKCERARNLIHADLDGEIKAEQQRALQSHVETCESCRALRAQFKAMAEGFEWLTDQSEVFPRSAQAEPRTLRLPWVRRVAGFAVAAAACLALYLVWPFGEPRDEIQIVSDQPDQPKLEFHLTGESFDKYLAVEEESTEPNVHIVWLYKNQGYSKESSRVDRPATTLHS